MLGELADRHPAGRELVLRHEDVDAVGLAVDMVVDPVELDFERLGREARATEYAEAAGPADGRDDVAAVAEGEQREVDSDQVTHDVHGGEHAASGRGRDRPVPSADATPCRIAGRLPCQ